MIKQLIVLAWCFSAAAAPESIEQLAIGNFALPTSQQPGPLFSLGQNIIDKHDLLLDDLFFRVQARSDTSATLFLNGFLYGVTDSFSVLWGIPTNFFKDANKRSSGLGDLFMQAEYAVYNKDSLTSNDQATVLASASAPSGSVRLFPPLGTGALGLFFGATASHISIDWYYFLSVGVVINLMARINTNNTYFYECGIGRNLAYLDDMILLALLEINGIAGNLTAVRGRGSPLFDGKVLFVGPSLFFSGKELILQLGIQAPVWQRVGTTRLRSFYRLGFSCAWKF